MLVVRIALVCLFGVLLSGCSLTRLTARQTAAMIIRAAPAYDRETDLELAEQAIVGNLKLLDGLLEVAPDDRDLLLFTSSSYSRYAFGFIEGEMDAASERNDLEAKERLLARAVDFHERGMKYGLRALSQAHEEFPEVLEQGLDALSSALNRMRKKDVPALFWTAYAWGNIVNLQQDEPARIAELPQVELMMRRVLELDEVFYFGGPHLFYGVYFGSRPRMLGGDPEKARQHLLRAVEITGGKYLLARFLLARFYAIPAQDRVLFEKTLTEILAAPPDLFPEQALANQIARRNAAHWLRHADWLFY